MTEQRHGERSETRTVRRWRVGQPVRLTHVVPVTDEGRLVGHVPTGYDTRIAERAGTRAEPRYKVLVLIYGQVRNRPTVAGAAIWLYHDDLEAR